MLMLDGTLHLPCRGHWYAVESPNACRTLWRIGFSHLAAPEIDPEQINRFICPRCESGTIVLTNIKDEGWYLACDTASDHQCYYRRRLSLRDARLKVRLANMKCPLGHPLTVQMSRTGMFLACENYPAHKHAESLRLLAGT